jgi:hypothetical protein
MAPGASRWAKNCHLLAKFREPDRIGLDLIGAHENELV